MNEYGIFSGELRPLFCRHWSPGGFDARFWVMFGMTAWGIDDRYFVVDDFGTLVPMGVA